MQFKSFALLALSATGAVAAEEKRQQILPTDSVGSSVFSVLATAIPPDVASLAINNPLQLSAQLASSIAAGQTPSWYQALPSDVKSYLPKLFPASASATPTPSNTNPIASVVSSIVSSVSASVSASVSNALNSTTISSVKSATLSASSTGGSGSASGKASSSSSSGGAAYPTAVVGAGVAGALGFLGMLAL